MKGLKGNERRKAILRLLLKDRLTDQEIDALIEVLERGEWFDRLQ